MNTLSLNLLLVASFLTEPICRAHEYSRRIAVVELVHPDESPLSQLLRKVLFIIGILVCGLIGIPLALVGLIIRACVVTLMPRRFVALPGKAAPKQYFGELSLFSWNICGISAGYSISDGGVMPWRFRIDAVAKRILEQDADVVCLQETFDPQTARCLMKRLGATYSYFYPVIGPRTLGVSGGLFVASKFPVHNPEFLPFPSSLLVGRTKFMLKGIFSFSVGGQESGASIHVTHLQHSEECDFPSSLETAAREGEMKMIVDKISHDTNKGPILVLGDLNLDDHEYESSSWKNVFEERPLFSKKTWGGDLVSARIVGKRASPPLNLDYILIKKGTARDTRIEFVDSGYVDGIFSGKALSDHNGLRVHVR